MKSAGFSPLVSPYRAARAGINSLQKDLVAYWSFNNSLTNDDSGNGYSLTNNGSVTSVAALIRNGASFNGSAGQYLSTADAAALRLTVSFTVAFWFNMTTYPDYLMAKGIEGATKGWQITYAAARGGQVSFSLYAPGGNTAPAVAGTPATGVWHLLVAWTDTLSAYLQIDNGTVATQAWQNGAVPVPSTSAVTVGTRDALDGTVPIGTYDEIGFWARVLSAQERAALYNGGSAITYPFLGV